MSFLNQALQMYQTYEQATHPSGQGQGGQQYPGQQYQQQPQQQQQYSAPSSAPPGYYSAPSSRPPPPSYPQEQYQNYQAPDSYHQYQAPSGPPPPKNQSVPQSQGTVGQQTDGSGHVFQYSNCSGTKKALLIGINYYGSQNQLKGCVNDVHNVQEMLNQRFGYRSEDTVILTDDARDVRSQPTRDNMIRAMQWLVHNAKPNDSLFFHYSGHGTLTDAVSADDYEGHAEAICPVDYQNAGLLVDDDLYDLLVKPLPVGCRLTAVFDSCHSGSAVDLPYAYSTKGTVKEPNIFANAAPDLMNAGMAVLSGNDLGALMTAFGAASKAYHTKSGVALARQTKTAGADVIAWGGCKDSQTSADTQEAGQATGAMSYAFVRAVNTHQRVNYQQFLVALREEMQRGGYSQKPQLSACHPIDTSLEFII
ncbi:hypothetical protein CspHIS471_0407490 [Cutaneotrichosporon sp. HIS471]|nr:hypothetical protein CspHIS471_0407490 [Cutaneotrichosporon sp. HIS471]